MYNEFQKDLHQVKSLFRMVSLVKHPWLHLATVAYPPLTVDLLFQRVNESVSDKGANLLYEPKTIPTPVRSDTNG
jgi:hypothetical protein